MSGRALPFSIAAAVFLLDRLTKGIIKAHLSSWDSIPVIPKFLNIVHVENPGVAFGLLADSTTWRPVLLIGVSTAVLVLISVLLWRGNAEHHWMLRLGLSFVLGGALGNLFDRVLVGTVTDFVEVHGGTYYFPTFNVADSAITVGAVFLLLDMLAAKRKQPASAARANSNAS